MVGGALPWTYARMWINVGQLFCGKDRIEFLKFIEFFFIEFIEFLEFIEFIGERARHYQG